jgi:hypothetical protein
VVTDREVVLKGFGRSERPEAGEIGLSRSIDSQHKDGLFAPKRFAGVEARGNAIPERPIVTSGRIRPTSGTAYMLQVAEGLISLPQAC